MRVVSLLVVLCVLGCKEEQEGFELNDRRIAELAAATCSCSDSVSNQTCTISYEDSLKAGLLAQVNAGRVRVNSDRWVECIAELRQCLLAADVCERLFEGTLDENAECASNQECAPGFQCVPGESDDAKCSGTGTCEKVETFERGERCERTGACEEDDDVCGMTASGAPIGGDGDEDAGAEAGDLADAGDSAAPDPGARELTCRKPIERGDPCPVEALGLEGTLLCESGTACVPDGELVVCGKPIEAGERCAFAIGTMQGAGPCKSGNFCSPASGVCEPFDFPDGADLGEDCEMRSDCLPGLLCIDDECARPLPNGSECDGDDQCAAHCFDGQCAPTYIACGLL